MNVPLAEIIEHRHLLSPREAATLTLAIGREWERRRACHSSLALPDHTHILLTPAGAIILASAPSASPQPAVARTLSALLGQLLGLDEEVAPRHHVPGGLLITIAGQLGPVDLPSSRDDGFMSALSRFAESEHILVDVYRRVKRARHASAVNVRPAHKVRRGPERRRQPPAVAALRRAVRDLERETFEAKARARARTITAPPVALNRRRLGQALAACATALLVAAGGFLLGSRHTSQSEVSDQVLSPAAVAAPTALIRVGPERTTRMTEPRPSVVTRPVRIRRTSTKKPQRSNHAASTIFAGGTRAIVWAH